MTVEIICTNIVLTMDIQTIFKTGNSSVVSIPKHLMQELKLKKGEKVLVEKAGDDTIIIKKKTRIPASTAKSAAEVEFKKWLDIFMEENGEILDELAVR